MRHDVFYAAVIRDERVYSKHALYCIGELISVRFATLLGWAGYFRFPAGTALHTLHTAQIRLEKR